MVIQKNASSVLLKLYKSTSIGHVYFPFERLFEFFEIHIRRHQFNFVFCGLSTIKIWVGLLAKN